MKNKQQSLHSVGELINTGASIHHRLLARYLLKFVKLNSKKISQLKGDQSGPDHLRSPS